MDCRVRKALASMQSDLRRTNLMRLASNVGLMPAHFARLFRNEVGLSPAKFLKQLRMERAKVLLETTDLSIKEIIAAVGFTDESHFRRDFKNRFGLPPAQYRRNHRENSIL
jgi:transcriptional regulator GlxA family with amidase domain